MRFVRTVAVLLVISLLPWGCARKKRAPPGHGEGPAGVPVVIPTPDTTPVEALRTPAGLVLKTGPEPTGTPAPAATTPAAAAR